MIVLNDPVEYRGIGEIITQFVQLSAPKLGLVHVQ